MIRILLAAVALGAMAVAPVMRAQGPATPQGPVGPSPYTVVRGWHKPFAAPGFAFGGNSGVFAESPDRIFIAQRGEFRLPDPLPQGFAGFARYACKMATGSGKTTVMGMLAAWSILNKVNDRSDARFSDVVLIVCPNVTIKSRLGELKPEEGEASLYRTRDLVPPCMIDPRTS